MHRIALLFLTMMMAASPLFAQAWEFSSIQNDRVRLHGEGVDCSLPVGTADFSVRLMTTDESLEFKFPATFELDTSDIVCADQAHARHLRRALRRDAGNIARFTCTAIAEEPASYLNDTEKENWLEYALLCGVGSMEPVPVRVAFDARYHPVPVRFTLPGKIPGLPASVLNGELTLHPDHFRK